MILTLSHRPAVYIRSLEDADNDDEQRAAESDDELYNDLDNMENFLETIRDYLQVNSCRSNPSS